MTHQVVMWAFDLHWTKLNSVKILLCEAVCRVRNSECLGWAEFLSQYYEVDACWCTGWVLSFSKGCKVELLFFIFLSESHPVGHSHSALKQPALTLTLQTAWLQRCCFTGGKMQTNRHPGLAAMSSITCFRLYLKSWFVLTICLLWSSTYKRKFRDITFHVH